jgi:hypothetical protein
VQNVPDDLPVVFMCAVGEIQPKNIHPRLGQFEQHLVAAAGRADRCHYFSVVVVFCVHNRVVKMKSKQDFTLDCPSIFHILLFLWKV